MTDCAGRNMHQGAPTVGSLDIGGSETQLVELATRLDRSEVRAVRLLLGPGGPLAATPLGGAGSVRSSWVSQVCAAFRDPRRARGRTALRGCCGCGGRSSGTRPDVVHGFLITAYVTATSLAARRACDASWRAGAVSAGSRNTPVALAPERLADRLTDLFIANSEAVRMDTLDREPIDPIAHHRHAERLEFERFGETAARERPPRRRGSSSSRT